MILTKCFMTCNLTILKYFFEFFVDLRYDRKTFLYISIFFNDCSKYVSVVSSCNQYWTINTKFITARAKFRTLLHWMMKNEIIIDIICRTIVFCSTSIHCLTFEKCWKRFNFVNSEIRRNRAFNWFKSKHVDVFFAIFFRLQKIDISVFKNALIQFIKYIIAFLNSWCSTFVMIVLWTSIKKNFQAKFFSSWIHWSSI